MRWCAAGLAVVVLAAAAARVDAQTVGWSIAMKMTRDTGASATAGTTVSREWITPRMLRIEVDHGNAPASMRRNYMLMATDDSTVTMVSPARRTATVTLRPPIHSSVEAISRSVTNTLTDLGPAEPILGHPTRRYRRVSRGSVVESIAGHRCTVRIDATTEYWVAPDVNAGNIATSTLQRMDPEMAEVLTRATATAHDTMPRGTPLREVRRAVIRDGQEHTQTSTRTFEFTELSHGPIPDSVFQIPNGYARYDIRRAAIASSKKIDSLMRAAGERLAARVCAPGG